MRFPTYKPPSFGGPTRPNANQRGYGRQWRKIRAEKLAANPWCEYCQERIEREGKAGIEGPALACDVDHVDSNTANVSWGNLKSACRPCHNRKTHGR